MLKTDHFFSSDLEQEVVWGPQGDVSSSGDENSQSVPSCIVAAAQKQPHPIAIWAALAELRAFLPVVGSIYVESHSFRF